MTMDRDIGGQEVGIPRRGVLRALLGAVVASVVIVLYPIARYLRPRVTDAGGGAQEVVAPYKVNELRPDAAGNWPAPFNFGGRPCLLIRDADGEVAAFDAICTHVDCTVQFRPEHRDIFCNCHNGVYDLKGRNVSGPPPRPLTPYKVKLRGKLGQEEIIVSRGA